LNNFNKLYPISLIFFSLHYKDFPYKPLLYFLTEPAVNLLYLAIFHSGVNDVLPFCIICFKHEVFERRPYFDKIKSASCKEIHKVQVAERISKQTME